MINPGVILLIIGNEILAGRRQDAHFANTLEACKKRSIKIREVHYLPDDEMAMLASFRLAREKNCTILSFGGIGATPDDKTRAIVADVLGIPLELQCEGVAILKQKYGVELNDIRLQLVNFPQGSSLIPNPINGVPGFSIQNIHCVPGFPQMAQPMIEWVLDQHIKILVQPLVYYHINAFLFESEAIPLLEMLEREFPDISISCLPKLNKELELGFEGSEQTCSVALSSAKSWLDTHNFKWE